MKTNTTHTENAFWVYPFAITLAASLVFFLLQMAEYTTILG
jgi:hypothetical protein